MSKALSFTHERSLFFLFFLFYQYTALSSRAVDGRHMYSGGLVVEIVTFMFTFVYRIRRTCDIPSLIFTGAKSAKFGVVFNVTQILAGRVLKCSKL